MTVSSCDGQDKSNAVKAEFKEKSIAKVVAQIDPKSTLIYQDKHNNYWFVNKDKGVYKNDGKTTLLFTSCDGGYAVILFKAFKNSGGTYKYNGKTFEKFRMN